MPDELTVEWFSEVFEGLTVTLMDSHSLRRELALLRAALPPSTYADAPARPLLWAEERLALTDPLRILLPSVPPDSVSVLQPRLSTLSRSESEQVRRLVDDAWRLLRGWPNPAQLWLVAAPWNHRIAYLLESSFFPTSVHSYGQRLRWKSAD